MSTESTQTRPIGVGQAHDQDPLAALDAGDVVRCRDSATGWTWYYALETESEIDAEPGSDLARVVWQQLVDETPVPICYHERKGFDTRLVSRTDIAETVDLESVTSDVVGWARLERARGEL